MANGTLTWTPCDAKDALRLSLRSTKKPRPDWLRRWLETSHWHGHEPEAPRRPVGCILNGPVIT